MQKDFHFYAIGILAKHAGFSNKDALTVATASQYVDHAVESFPIRFSNGRIVETTMSAHYHIRSFEWGVQQKVFMCFHFIPEGRLAGGGFSFRTVPDGPVIRGLLNEILDQKMTGDSEADGGAAFWQYRLGVALHSYADTWAHQTFSGRKDDENNVGKIWFREKGKWDRKRWADWKWDFAPQIGHAESGHFPDAPYLKWRYELGPDRAKKTRDNPKQFQRAAEKCLGWLNKFSDHPAPWDPSAPAMKAIRSLTTIGEKDGEKRIKRWKTKGAFKPFKSFFAGSNDYDKLKWRAEALHPTSQNKKLLWEGVDKNASIVFKARKGFDTSSFRLFHKAAKLQRAYILDKLFW
jgi:Family of unknown function (DUF6765)